MRLDRLFSRTFLLVTVFLLSVFAGRPVQGDSAGTSAERRLRLYHTHTGERIDIVYRQGDTYLPEATAKLDEFLRDHRTGDVRHYDPQLYDLLSDLTAAVGHLGAEIAIICGYRTAWSNEFLRAHTAGVAKHSLHMQAKAIDIRLPGTDPLALRNAALSLHRGGVGYYPRSGFVHVDVGRVTQWCFGCTGKVSESQ